MTVADKPVNISVLERLTGNGAFRSGSSDVVGSGLLENAINVEKMPL